MINEIYISSGDCYRNLADAIINQSCEDFMKHSWKVFRMKYLTSLSSRQQEEMSAAMFEIKQILSFFRSEWFHTLTDLNADYLINKLYEEVSFMPVLEYRNIIKAIASRINRKEREIKLIRLSLESPSSPKYNDMPSSHSNTSKTEAGLCKISELEEDIEKETKELLAVRDEVCSLIDTLEDKDNRDILYKYIVELKTWETVANEMLMSIPTVYRRRRESLRFLTEIKKTA